MRLQQTDPGFDARGVLTASVSLPEAAYSKDEQLTAFYDRVTEQAAALPGVEAVGAIMPLPLGDNNMTISFTVNGQPDPGAGAQPVAGARIITPGYLRAMGVPLARGRGFNDADTADSPKVIIINQTLARRYFPGEEPLGKRLTVGLNDIDGEVVGVVGDVHDESLVKEPKPEFYVPYKQVPMGSMSLVVRTKGGDPNALAAPLRSVVQSADKDLPVYQIRPMERLVSDSVARQRFSMTLLVAFAGLALALAAVGIFSVMSFLVAQRTHEIGVRVALGAQGRDILLLVLGYGMALVLAGIVVGLAGAFALTRLMTALLYGVSATDALTFAGVPVLLGAVALLACLVPARRATKVDPMVALRYE